MLFFVLSVCLSIGNGILPDIPTTVDSDVNRTVEANVSQGHATLNDMFKEVEELMEDTQHKLEDAVHQVGDFLFLTNTVGIDKNVISFLSKLSANK